jgi:hypothetical protein
MKLSSEVEVALVFVAFEESVSRTRWSGSMLLSAEPLRLEDTIVVGDCMSAGSASDPTSNASWLA